LGKRQKRLESLSGLAAPKDEFRERSIKIVREFGQGEGI